MPDDPTTDAGDTGSGDGSGQTTSGGGASGGSSGNDAFKPVRDSMQDWYVGFAAQRGTDFQKDAGFAISEGPVDLPGTIVFDQNEAKFLGKQGLATNSQFRFGLHYQMPSGFEIVPGSMRWGWTPAGGVLSEFYASSFKATAADPCLDNILLLEPDADQSGWGSSGDAIAYHPGDYGIGCAFQVRISSGGGGGTGGSSGGQPQPTAPSSLAVQIFGHCAVYGGGVAYDVQPLVVTIPSGGCNPIKDNFVQGASLLFPCREFSYEKNQARIEDNPGPIFMLNYGFDPIVSSQPAYYQLYQHGLRALPIGYYRVANSGDGTYKIVGTKNYGQPQGVTWQINAFDSTDGDFMRAGQWATSGYAEAQFVKAGICNIQLNYSFRGGPAARDRMREYLPSNTVKRSGLTKGQLYSRVNIHKPDHLESYTKVWPILTVNSVDTVQDSLPIGNLYDGNSDHREYWTFDQPYYRNDQLQSGLGYARRLYAMNIISQLNEPIPGVLVQERPYEDSLNGVMFPPTWLTMNTDTNYWITGASSSGTLTSPDPDNLPDEVNVCFVDDLSMKWGVANNPTLQGYVIGHHYFAGVPSVSSSEGIDLGKYAISFTPPTSLGKRGDVSQKRQP